MEPDLQSHLRSVSTRAELERFLEDVRFLQTSSTARMAQLGASVQAKQKLQDLYAARNRLSGSLPAASAASTLLSSACDVGAGVRSRIDDVVVIYERARGAREMVDQVIILRSCIQGIYGAMEVRDWERAAELAQRAREIPEDVAKSDFAIKMVPTIELPDPPLTSLKAACDDLADLFTREFSKATAQRQMDQVTRHFKLFPLVGHEDQGLKLYAQFICQIVAGLSRQLLASAEQSTKQNPGFYSAVLSRLFENIAVIIDQHSRVVNRHYGPEAMPQKVMPSVQSEIDKQAGLILDTFWDERRMEMLLTSCKSYSFPYLIDSFTRPSGAAKTNSSTESASLDDTSDLQEASARLSELSTMLNRWYLYTTFVRQKWTIADGSKLSESINGSIVAVKISEILGPTFSTLSLFIFRRSVERAVQLDELPTKRAIDANPEFSMESPLVSSAVDDTMYVFSNLLEQTVDAGHLPTQLSAVAGFRRVLESDLVGTFQRKLRASAPVDSAASTGEFGGAGAFMIYLNDLEVCAHYVGETIQKQGSISSELAEQLSKFNESFKGKASELLLDGCQTLAAMRVASQAKQIASSSFKVVAYTTQVESNRCGAVFKNQWLQLIRPLRQLLHPDVLAHVLSVVLPSIAQQLERFVWSLNGKITDLGCISLDRDISLVIGVTSEVQYNLRHKFVKLAQMVNALTDQYLPAEDLNALSAEEHKRILGFKVVRAS